ncbi:MAG: GntR family transcriptional regulator [Rhizobiaceae bacterium]|nr:GntR family transcriptional regulator [Rhizobiaceae bacterium]
MHGSLGITGRIDRSSPEPYYMQLSRLVEAQIEAGDFAAGDRLPSETELCRSFDLARSTVRETLRSLQDRGIIKMVPRRGAFVAGPKPAGWLLQVAEGFFEGKVDHENESVETRVLSAGLKAAPPDVREALGLPEGAQVYVLRRLRSLDGKTAMYSINYLLPELQPIIEESAVIRGRGSLNRLLREAGYQLAGARRSVEAVSADDDLAKKLGVAEGDPLLLVTSQSWGPDNRVFDHYTSWLRSDVVKVTVVAKAAEG